MQNEPECVINQMKKYSKSAQNKVQSMHHLFRGMKVGEVIQKTQGLYLYCKLLYKCVSCVQEGGWKDGLLFKKKKKKSNGTELKAVPP